MGSYYPKSWPSRERERRDAWCALACLIIIASGLTLGFMLVPKFGRYLLGIAVAVTAAGVLVELRNLWHLRTLIRDLRSVGVFDGWKRLAYRVRMPDWLEASHKNDLWIVRVFYTALGTVFFRREIEMKFFDWPGYPDGIIDHAWLLTFCRHLRPLRHHVTRLDFEHNPVRAVVDDEVLVHVGKLVGLQWLDLSDTAVTDRGFAQLGKLSDLRKLTLHGVNLTNAGIRSLHSLRRLEELYVGYAATFDVSEVFTLRKAIPGLEVGPAIVLRTLAERQGRSRRLF